MNQLRELDEWQNLFKLTAGRQYDDPPRLRLVAFIFLGTVAYRVYQIMITL